MLLPLLRAYDFWAHIMSKQSLVQSTNAYIEELVNYSPSKSGTVWLVIDPHQWVALHKVRALCEHDIGLLDDQKLQKFNAICIRAIVSSKIYY